jgi:hypothetical protein
LEVSILFYLLMSLQRVNPILFGGGNDAPKPGE